MWVRGHWVSGYCVISRRHTETCSFRDVTVTSPDPGPFFVFREKLTLLYTSAPAVRVLFGSLIRDQFGVLAKGPDRISARENLT